MPSRRTWFAPREIAIRNAWGVRWIRLSRGAQVSALALGLAAFGWVSHATITTLSMRPADDGRDETIAQLQADLARQAQLNGEVAALRAQRDAAEAARTILEKQMTARANDRDEARPTNPALPAAAPAMADDSAALSLELSAAYDERRRLLESLQVAEDRLAAMERTAGATRDLLAQAERRATTLSDRIVALETVQGALVDRLTPATAMELTRLEGQLGSTGLDLSRIVPTGGPGQGGPLVELAQAPPPPGSAVEKPESRDRLLLLTSGIVRLDTLRAALPAIPLATPLTHYELRSGFGTRMDPFRRRAAFHAGLDFAAPIGTPVKVTAPGEVVDAGWEGAYGRAVRVRHAFGIETRYAHLRSISVKVGDKLEAGDVVGKLGSSGRSTGPHVHYEVMLDDVPRDPIPFIEAGRHVQQTQDDK
ncbi:hypothetical protein D3874_08280 [Oleomonas cavernae]|uniref:M23ase beta-sheet core domain-containing protein n=1 Tax=Oleomonas cavernae TaxID=2320859 RepID=A0A418WAE9_9PROT|nr:hypothetical protein D3874_08280 [Oleomonas cavernae]